MTSIDPGKIKPGWTRSQGTTFFALCVDGASRKIWAGGDDGAIAVFDGANPPKEPIARWTRHENYVSGVVLARLAAGPVIISGSYDRQLIWWNAESGEVIRTVPGHDGWVRRLALTPDGAHLVSVGDDMLVKVWDAETGRLVRSLSGHALQTPQGHVSALYAVALSGDGQWIASGDRVGNVRVWELGSGQLAQTFEVPTLYTYDPRQRKRSIGGIRGLTFSPDGNSLAVGGIGQVPNVDGLTGPVHVEVWDWRKPARRWAAGAEGHKGLVNDLVFHPCEPWLIGGGGGGDGGFLAFWKLDPAPTSDAQGKDAFTGRRVKVDGFVHALAWGAAGSELFSAGYRRLDIWPLT
ncbi:MAG: hypothetical protein NZ700_16215 [Gemmataceae bacterium]|nr:hypothetical protein [Gemmataceae bacterium]MDW8264244.1 hypothetical protein [Gemmataceae bacterium]